MLEYALKQERAKYAKVGRLLVHLLNQDLGKQKAKITLSKIEKCNFWSSVSELYPLIPDSDPAF
jgi:hypothetical protein